MTRAVGGQRLADGVQAFLHRIVNEAAGVDDHQVSAFAGLAGFVAFGAQLREDQFGVRERLGAAQRDERNLRGALGQRAAGVLGHGAIFNDGPRATP
jgi:hypothetical protein